MDLNPYLEDLESRIDEAAEQDLIAQYKNFWEHGGANPEIPRRKHMAKPKINWEAMPVNHTLNNYDNMAYSQLCGVSKALASENGCILCMRANYGTGIMPSLFGAEIYVMDIRHDTLPTSRHLPGGFDAIKKILSAGVPDLNNGQGGQVFEMYARFVEMLKPYPKLSRNVMIYHPDMQGPMDICELLWGSDIFYDLIDRPQAVHELLALVTETYIAFMERFTEYIPHTGYTCHKEFLIKGNIMLRDDSAMNLSSEMFDEFIKPYDQRLLTRFGGGLIHFCGRGDHYIETLSGISALNGINMTQPEYNDMEIILQNTVDKGLCIAGFNLAVAEELVRQGRDLRGRVLHVARL